MIDRFVGLVKAPKICSQIEEKTYKKTKDGQQLAWGRNADFQCFPNKSVRILEANSFHCRLHHVTKNMIFVRVKENWLCLDYKCAHFAAHLTLMTGNMAIMHDDVPRKHLLKDFPDFLVFYICS